MTEYQPTGDGCVECLLCDSIISAEFGTAICDTCKEMNPTVVDPEEFVKLSWARASWFDPYPFTVVTGDGGESDKRFTCCSMSLPYHAQDCSNDPEYIAECNPTFATITRKQQ